MTYTKMVDRLHEIASVQGFPTDDLVDAADAIEALQEKNALLEGTLESRERNITELQAENERLNRQWAEWSDSLDSVMKQRNALKAKLDAAPKAPEPLTAKEDWDIRGILASKLRVFHRTTEAEADELISLFSSMKSRTSLTQPEVVEAFCNTPHNVQYVSVFDAGVRFAEKHHGITKGTP